MLHVFDLLNHNYVKQLNSRDTSSLTFAFNMKFDNAHFLILAMHNCVLFCHTSSQVLGMSSIASSFVCIPISQTVTHCNDMSPLNVHKLFVLL